MVEYLKIFGKEYPVRIGYYVMKKVKEETGKSFSKALEEVEQTGDISLHEIILYSALQMGIKADPEFTEELDLTKEDMPMALDVCFAEYLKLFESETFFPKELQEKMEVAEKKRSEFNKKVLETQEKGNGQESQRTKKPQKKT